MAMITNHSLEAASALGILSRNASALTRDLAKVSSGMRVTGAADGASEYAISERMRVQIRSLGQDDINAKGGLDLLRVAEGAVSSTVDILRAFKEKAIDAANDHNTDDDRATIQKELDQAISQVNDNAAVMYNGKRLIDGSCLNAGTDVPTYFTNMSLSPETTGTTAMVLLRDWQEQSLHLEATDLITVSYVSGGRTCSTTYPIGRHTLADVIESANGLPPQMGIISETELIGQDGSGNDVMTASHERAVTICAKNAIRGGVSTALRRTRCCLRRPPSHERSLSGIGL